MSKCELSLEVLQIASISQITHSPMQRGKISIFATFGDHLVVKYVVELLFNVLCHGKVSQL